jgi:glycosyltransferase involved in cell wall biosynthesis
MINRPFGITVVIPAYGRREEIVRAIESINGPANQVEIIVVDDASPEDLRSFLPDANSAGLPIRSYRLSRNRGPQAARNLGIRRAGFSHVAFLDSDDAFISGKCVKVLASLDGGSVDVLLHTVGGMERYSRFLRWWQCRAPGLPLRWLASAYNPVSPNALVVRRRPRLGLERLRHCEDYAFLLRYLEPDTLVRFLDEDLATVHRAPGSKGGLSGDLRKMRKGEFQARKVLLRHPTADNITRYVIGTVFGCARVLNDVLRGRYF